MALAATFALVWSTSAAEQVLTINPDASRVGIHLKATGHDIEGLFHLRQGQVRFDTDTGLATGEVVVEAVGAATGSGSRDKTMHKKVLESAQYPLIVFRPQSVEGELAPEGESEIKLNGTMTLVGSEHPMTLLAHVDVEGGHLKAMTTFEIPYVEWGLHDPSIFLLKVAKQVGIEISAEGTLADEAPAESNASASIGVSQ